MDCEFNPVIEKNYLKIGCLIAFQFFLFLHSYDATIVEKKKSLQATDFFFKISHSSTRCFGQCLPLFFSWLPSLGAQNIVKNLS